MDDDGLIRCGWAGLSSGPHAEMYRNYHDQEWGRPRARRDGVVRADEPGGLSERPVVADHPAQTGEFPAGVRGFDVEKVARFKDADVQRLLADDGIVRNRAKIEATIANARAAVELGSPDDLSELLWSFAPPPRPRPAEGSEIPSASAESKAMARELKRRGFRFVGPTTAYALMQATGMVDDHIRDCWVAPVRR